LKSSKRRAEKIGNSETEFISTTWESVHRWCKQTAKLGQNFLVTIKAQKENLPRSVLVGCIPLHSFFSLSLSDDDSSRNRVSSTSCALCPLSYPRPGSVLQ
jgi:hypothetical protein